MRNQNVLKLCHDTGSFYIFKTKSLLRYNRCMPKKTTYYFIDKYRSIDINTESDFRFAEFIYKYINKQAKFYFAFSNLNFIISSCVKVHFPKVKRYNLTLLILVDIN